MPLVLPVMISHKNVTVGVDCHKDAVILEAVNQDGLSLAHLYTNVQERTAQVIVFLILLAAKNHRDALAGVLFHIQAILTPDQALHLAVAAIPDLTALVLYRNLPGLIVAK